MILEFYDTSPWLTFFLVVVILQFVGNRLDKLGKREADTELLDKALDSNRELRTELNACRFKLREAENKLYHYKNSSSTDWERAKREQANRAQQERDRYSQFTSSRQFNFDDMKRAEEAMFNQQNQRRGYQTGAKQNTNPTWETIKAKYKADMKANHPDSIQARGGSAADIASATINAQRINEQYKKDKKRYGK